MAGKAMRRTMKPLIGGNTSPVLGEIEGSELTSVSYRGQIPCATLGKLRKFVAFHAKASFPSREAHSNFSAKISYSSDSISPDVQPIEVVCRPVPAISAETF